MDLQKTHFQTCSEIILEGNWFPPVCVFGFPREPPPVFPIFPNDVVVTNDLKGFASKVFTGLGCLEGGNWWFWKVPPIKLTWQWKITIFNREYIFNWSIFHCHVSLPEGTVDGSEIRLTSWAKGSFFPSKYKVIHPRWLATLSINSILLSPRKLTYPPEKMMLERRLFLPFWNGASSTFVCFSGMYWFEVRPKPSASGNLFLHLHFQRLGKKWQTWKPEKWYLCVFFVRWALKLASGWWGTSYLFSKGFRMATTSDIILSLSLDAMFLSRNLPMLRKADGWSERCLTLVLGSTAINWIWLALPPPKTNMTMERPGFWRCISYWKWGDFPACFAMFTRG